MKATGREIVVYAAVRLGWLEIRADGSVWRVAQRRKSRWDGKVTVKPVRPRRIDAPAGGYRQVKLMVDGIQTGCLAHRLVWLHLHGPIPEGLSINHKNGDKADNRPGNLELVTPSENNKHAYRTGLKDEHGEANPASKLSDFQVEVIRTRYSTGGETQAAIAVDYGVCHQTISDIVRGRRRPKQGGPTADYTARRQRAPRERNRKGQFA
jgi:hypothetical protein